MAVAEKYSSNCMGELLSHEARDDVIKPLPASVAARRMEQRVMEVH